MRLRLEVLRRRQRFGQPVDDEFRGLYISEEEIDDLIASNSAGEAESALPSLADSPIALQLHRLEDKVAARRSVSLASGLPLRLCELAQYFGLTDFESDTLLLCLLPEIDTKYEKLFAYLHDDVTRKRPSVNLVLQCLLDSLSERVVRRESFAPQSPLIANHLLRVEDDLASRTPPLLTRTLKVDDRIVNYLVGSDHIDPRLKHAVRLVSPTACLDDLILSEQLRKPLMRLSRRATEGVCDVIYLEGPPGIGKRTVAEALCQQTLLPLLMVDIPSFLKDDTPFETEVILALREAQLQRAALCWNRIDLLLSEDKVLTAYLDAVIEGNRNFPAPVFATGESPWHPGDSLGAKPFVQIELSYPSHSDRRHLWKIYLNGHGAKASDSDVASVADVFRFTPGQIKDAATTAQNLALSHGEAQISTDNLYAACRVMSNQKLSLLARKIQPKYEWGDIVLPQDQKTQLREIANYVKYRQTVLTDWNFENKISLGKGLNVLFAGPSGTGKTMASEIIARELGLDLYKIDLSTVISKYIGETEKNLDRIFTEAQNSNAILFFDEADAVFGKRSEIRDSHDRYANIEVAYLLEFPQPEEPDRYQIWKRVFPEKAPVKADLDLNFMARQFKITGGNIKNIALGAAFLAADDGGTITIEHLIRATRREFQKIGRLCNESDFGPYFELVKS
jgi:ATP-dependent 26S proteasome regulatory subunit